MKMDKEKPTVSVIIPTYNRAHLVSRAIQSVLNQTYQDFELIVVDDASRDNTEEVIKQFNDERIKYFRHEKNKGGSTARNTGIKASRGRYITLLDDDDEWLPHHLEQSVEIMHKLKKDWGVVYTGRIVITEKKTKNVYPKWKGKIFRNILVKGSPGTPGTALIRRSCFNQVGLFDERFPRYQDWEMYLRLAKQYKFYPIYDASVKRFRDSSPSIQKVLEAQKLFFDKFSNDIKALSYMDKRRFYSMHYLRLAQLYFEEKNLLDGVYWFAKGLVKYPFRLGPNLNILKRAFTSLL